MTATFHEMTVGSFEQMLGALKGVLEKGASHCRDKGIDPATLVEARLYPDMAPLNFQVAGAVRHSRGALEALESGVSSPSPGSATLDYAGLQSLVADTETALKRFEAARIDALQETDVSLKVGSQSIPFTGKDFMLSFSLPSFYFHMTTAYDILRANGVPVGKRDYLGALKIKS